MDDTNAISLLTRMGVADADKLDPERATTKLRKKLAVINDQNGTLPKDVTDDEAKLAVSLGYIPLTQRMAGKAKLAVIDDPITEKVEVERPLSRQPVAFIDKMLQRNDEAAPTDPFKIPRLYRLPPNAKGEGERIEEIPPAMAASRNARRNDGRKWEPYDGKKNTVVDAKPITTSGPTTIIPVALTTESENDVSKKNTKKASDKIKVVQAKRTSPRAKAEKKDKAPKAPKVAKVKGSGKNPKRSGNGGELMRKIFHENGVSIDRDKLIEKLIAGGVSQGTATSYISWAKRTNPDTPDKGNPFGFVLEEEKDGKDKTLTRVKAIGTPAVKPRKAKTPKAPSTPKAAKPKAKKATVKKEPKAEAATPPEEPVPSLAASAV